MRKKGFRIAAFLLACICAGVCGYSVCAIYTDYPMTFDRNYSDCYAASEECAYETGKIYDQLWAIGTMYLRNLDSKGKLTGTKEFIAGTEAEMKRLGLMDSKGGLTVEDNGLFDYYVEWEGQSWGNTKKTYDELKNDFSTGIRKNDIFVSRIHNYWFHNENGVYDSNYGAHIYTFSGSSLPFNRAVVYDFDTTGLPSWYVQDAKYYYRTDGTTLVPDDYIQNANSGRTGDEQPQPWYDDMGRYHYYYTEYNDSRVTLHEVIEDGENTIDNSIQPETKAPDADTGKSAEVDIYDYDSVTANNSKFFNTRVNTQPLTICITPHTEIIAEAQKSIDAEKVRSEDIVHRLIATIPFAAAFLLLTLYLMWAGGYSTKLRRYVSGEAEKIPAELPLAVLCLVPVGLVGIFVNDVFREAYRFFGQYYRTGYMPICYAAAAAIMSGIFLLMLDTLMIRLKCRSLMKSSLCGRLIVWLWRRIRGLSGRMTGRIRRTAEKLALREQLRDDSMSRRFIVRTAAASLAGFIAGILFISVESLAGVFFSAVIIVAAYTYFNLRDLRAYTDLSRHISAMNGGDYSRRETDVTSPIHAQTEKLNNISDGIQTAVDRQVQSERMKIDLVTNVSHDLKTPLTSIISYIDLLSQEELSPESRDFVTIIQQKAERLRTMVADLFDLAKATSRTDVEMERIDAVILTGQVLADMGDRISASGREVKADIQPDSAPVNADGKKLYRVLQNLIDNALKYSLEGTRVWLTLKEQNGFAVLTVKNTSSYEMDFTPEEITERFVRGDQSRTSEGNGLGLSIAKSFTEACGGYFRVIIDGDVFGAEVKLPTVI